MVSDYAGVTLVPSLVARVRAEAPEVVLDFMTPSDVTYVDLEQGKVDLAINRFDVLPQSFHQRLVWRDGFSVLSHSSHPLSKGMTLKEYLNADHVWVSKTGMGVGVGVHPEKDKSIQVGWVDEYLASLGYKRRICMFTRHYQVAALLHANPELLVTLPTRIATLQAGASKQAEAFGRAEDSGLVVQRPQFDIPPFELTMAWSPLLHHNRAHQWLRHLVVESAACYA
jgi:DNA-binding transcriptional LysR family regulator